MGVTKQLYQLQEVDSGLESGTQALSQIISRLGENQAVSNARSKLASEQQGLEELKHQQHSLEWEIDDVVAKLITAEEELYSGRIANPKELANLQREIDGLKLKRCQLEDKVLEVMEQVETNSATVSRLTNELETLEEDWRSQQQQLAADRERLEATLSELKHKRELLSAGIVSQAVELYDELKRQKGTAVAKVEQGICQGCRISLSGAELQRARGDRLSQCSNCGRILFLE
ncbi:MAG: hypothetical protein J7K77_04785 [Dehalococcoidales bacterium]|nr:hypothetical protein [Dehalococcoidales bacterium]